MTLALLVAKMLLAGPDHPTQADCDAHAKAYHYMECTLDPAWGTQDIAQCVCWQASAARFSCKQDGFIVVCEEEKKLPPDGGPYVPDAGPRCASGEAVVNGQCCTPGWAMPGADVWICNVSAATTRAGTW